MAQARIQVTSTEGPTITLPAPPAVGSLLVLGVWAGPDGPGVVLPTPAGWAPTADTMHMTGAAAGWGSRMFYKISAGGADQSVSPTSVGYTGRGVVLAEYASPASLDVAGSYGFAGTGPPPYLGNSEPAGHPAITPTAAIEALIVSLWSWSATHLPTINDISDQPENQVAVSLNAVSGPGYGRLVDRVVPATAGAYRMSGQWTDGHGHWTAAQLAVFRTLAAGGSFAGEPGGGLW